MKQWSDLLTLVTAFQTCRETSAVLKTLASHAAAALEARASLVWKLDHDGEGLVCTAAWAEPGWRVAMPRGAVTECLLNEALQAPRPLNFPAQELDSETLFHLSDHDRQRVRTALYAAVPGSGGPVGVVEVLNKDRGDFSADDAAFLEEVCRLAGRQLDAMEAIEEERRSSLSAVQRLTDLYDISRVFGATLEMAELLPIMGEKIRDLLEVRACNLWLVDAGRRELYLAHQTGDDPTTVRGARIPLGEGLLGTVAERGEPHLVEDATAEPQLEERRQSAPDFPLMTLMYAPLVQGQEVIGVLEVINKRDSSSFDEDALFFLSSICEQAAIALKNARLLDAERRAHDLRALLTTSKELTSTLNLDHVLTTVVHQASTVVPFDLSAIGVFDRSQFVLGAVSGESEVPKTPKMAMLQALLKWVAGKEGAVSADQREEGWIFDPSEAPPGLVPFMEENGYQGFYALPLRDDQGTVGVLALLSAQPDFLTSDHLEVLSILTSQTTVAIRNARLYQQVPLMNLWQPLMKRQGRLEETGAAPWKPYVWKAGWVVLALVLIPWKLRIQSNATVVPADRRLVSAEVSGVIQRVEVREGQQVHPRDVLASLDASDDRVRLVKAIADLEISRRQMAEAEARRDWATVSQARLAMDLHQSEVTLYREKVEKARLRAPISGVVVTPKVEEKVGQLLHAGDTFCELVDQEHMAAEMNVAETEVTKVMPGAAVALKLNALPTETFTGRVERVSPQTIAAEGTQFFVTRALFSNVRSRIRSGMAGQAKISGSGGWFQSGWYPIGYLLLRAPARWVWQKVWALWP